MPGPSSRGLGQAGRLLSVSIAAWARGTGLVLLVLALGACAQTKPYTGSVQSVKASSDARILLMPTDIELSELTAGGLLEPQAAWTEIGKANVHKALDAIFAEAGKDILRFEDGPADGQNGTADEGAYLQLLKLHRAVGAAILVHKYGPVLALPTKQNSFDWSLGEDTVTLGEQYQADYALFVFMRDSFSSSGRVALNVITALLGAGVQGGRQAGFASLVDLHTGNVVWFNILQSQYGDLREPESARSACGDLLDDLPI